MGRLSILVALVSALAGLALAGLAPHRWGVTPVHGFLLGLALYAAALRGKVERAIAGASGAAWLGLAARAAVFLALWWTQATLCFDVMPDADVRRGFITLSAWVVAQALLGGTPRREEARG